MCEPTLILAAAVAASAATSAISASKQNDIQKKALKQAERKSPQLQPSRAPTVAARDSKFGATGDSGFGFGSVGNTLLTGPQGASPNHSLLGSTSLLGG